MSCSLVEFTDKYLTQEYAEWLNDPVLMKYSEQRNYVHDLGSCASYVNAFNGTDNLLFAVIDDHSKRHVGNINAYVDRFNRVADVGILISLGGRGYGLSAWNQMLDILFAEPINIRKVTAGTMSENVGMIKIFENSGMHFEYKKLRQYCFEGRLIDMMAYYKENSK